MTVECGQRFSVIGTSGSGKTTTASQIARRLGIPHVELDALHWDPDWTPAPLDIFRERVAQALSGDTWAVDGNYGKVRDIVWSRADTIVWLDYRLTVIMWQLVQRTLRRSISQEELWGGNRESLCRALFSRESILLWALQTYRRRQREYPILFDEPEYAHLIIVHLRSPRDARAWLSSLTMPEAGGAVKQREAHRVWETCGRGLVKDGCRNLFRICRDRSPSARTPTSWRFHNRG